MLHGSTRSNPVFVILTRAVTRATTPPGSILTVGFATTSVRHWVGCAREAATSVELSIAPDRPDQ